MRPGVTAAQAVGAQRAADHATVSAARRLWRPAWQHGLTSSRPARCTSRFSLSTHSRRSASRACAMQQTDGEHSRAADGVVRTCVALGEHQRDTGPPAPSLRRGRRKRIREARPRDLAGDRPADRQLADGQIGRCTDDIAVLGQHLEAAPPSLVEPVLDDVEVAKEDVDGRAVDRQPCSAVHDRAPLAELGNVPACPADDVVGDERRREAR